MVVVVGYGAYGSAESECNTRGDRDVLLFVSIGVLSVATVCGVVFILIGFVEGGCLLLPSCESCCCVKDELIITAEQVKTLSH